MAKNAFLVISSRLEQRALRQSSQGLRMVLFAPASNHFRPLFCSKAVHLVRRPGKAVKDHKQKHRSNYQNYPPHAVTSGVSSYAINLTTDR
jgi:hypothetical protein